MSIQKNIISRTIGGNDDISQTFIQNNIIEYEEIETEPLLFRVPLFSLIGATYSYYAQDIDGISVNINNTKNLNYNYTANTSSFSAITKVIYDVYRVNFDIYDATLNNLDSAGDIIAPISSSTPTIETVASLLSTPIVTIYETGNTISIPTHNVSLPEIVKPVGEFAEQLLNDKAQYFVDTRFEFPQERDRTLGAYQIMSGGSPVDITLTGLTDTGEFLLETSQDTHIITGDTFSGISVNGAFFTYFIAPQKPNIDVIDGTPTVKGQLDTFSPIFSFNNVDDGDYYKLQVTYDITDTSFSAGTIFRINKQEGIPDFIRSFSVPLSPDTSFIYRIGNTKEIKNVFGVKQNVTTWGRFEEAFTATDGLFDISGTVFQDEFFGSPVSSSTISFVVTFTTSEVELGADASTNEAIAGGTFEPLGGGIGTSFSALTDSFGNYSLVDVKGGLLNVTVSHPLYETTTNNVNILSDSTNTDFIIILRWGSSTTFGQVGGQLFV